MAPSFHDLSLPHALVETLDRLGYQTPTDIQAQSIPLLLEGHDVLAQAPTGTGKTAAFGLAALSLLTTKVAAPQALILTPTRELAIQVADALQAYAQNMPHCAITAIYGGQAYDRQIKALKRGAHVVVGTPGRVMDHLRQGTLKTDAISLVVLDEADEMLNMGFIDDIEWILNQIDHQPQTALFSATMGAQVKTIAKRYLQHPQKVHVAAQKQSQSLIEQSAMMVPQSQRLPALLAYLETQSVDLGLIFVRTKHAAADLSERLMGWGYGAAALHGDMAQSMRERVIQRAKSGNLQIIVGTDVAARGIDLDAMSHVINFDLPSDLETYTHRIGRTGRAGRKGRALLFAPKPSSGFLKRLQQAGHHIDILAMPDEQSIRQKRMETLCNKVVSLLEKGGRGDRCQVLEQIQSFGPFKEADIIAALVHLLEKKEPKLPKISDAPAKRSFKKAPKRSNDRYGAKPKRSFERGHGRKKPSHGAASKFKRGKKSD